ncbi:MAG: YceI family protein [Bacteroidota bacterium]
MNKTGIHQVATIAGIIFLGACNQGPRSEKAKTSDAVDADKTEISGVSHVVDVEKSYINWIGHKPTGSHNGKVYLDEGTLVTKDSEIKGGSFTINMNTIENHDLKDPDRNNKLVRHLKSEDFFHVEVFPSATFDITDFSANPNNKNKGILMGNLTMRGITKSVSFPVTVKKENNSFTGTSEVFTIDRTDWDVNFKSKSVFENLRDDFINDEMELKIFLVAHEQ